MVYHSGEDVKNEVKAMCAFRGMTITSLSAKMGTAQPIVSRAINRVNPAFGTVRDIADALDCDLVFQFVPREHKKEEG